MAWTVAALAIGIVAAPLRAQADCAAANPAICLVGTVVAPDYRAALISEPGAPGVRRIMPGAEVDGWHVDRVMPRSIALSQADASVVLTIEGAAVTAPEPSTPRRPPINVVARNSAKSGGDSALAK